MTLPTLDALRAMPIYERGLAFLDWVKVQNPADTYYPDDIKDCALTKFGQAVMGPTGPETIASARTLSIYYSDFSIGHLTILRDYRNGDGGKPASPASPIWMHDILRHRDPHTYGDLAARLEIFLVTP